MRIVNKLKGVFGLCAHRWIYNLPSGFMGFAFRNVECILCGKKQSSLTHSTVFTEDKYTEKQDLTEKDFECFNNEIK